MYTAFITGDVFGKSSALAGVSSKVDYMFLETTGN